MNVFNLTETEAQDYLNENNCSALLHAGAKEEMPPKWDDLARLYSLVRERKPFTILEFGSGFSTVVMAYALKKNWKEYQDHLGRRAEGQRLSSAADCVTRIGR